MGKKTTTKRTRKFAAKGGVQKMLKKGNSFAKKGKVHLRRGGGGGSNKDGELKQGNKRDSGRMIEKSKKEILEKRDEEDFVGKPNLGDLDMEGFFKSVTEEEEEEDDDDDDEEMKEDIDDDDDDDDEEDEADEEVDDKEKSDKKKDATGDKSEGRPTGKSPAKNTSKNGVTKKDDDDDDDDDESVDIDDAEKSMKMELENLQKSDPDFHKFLKENEASLLEFGNDKEDDMDDEDEEEEEEKLREQTPNSAELDEEGRLLTIPMLTSIEKSAFLKHSIKGLRKIVSAYRSACHMSSEGKGADGGTRTFHIDDSAVFDRLMLVCLRKCHEEFRLHLLNDATTTKKEEGLDENKPLHPKQLENSERWNHIRPILQSFMRATIHLFSEAKEPNLLKFVLQSLSKYLPFLSPFPKIAKATLKLLTSLWSAPLDNSDTYNPVRLTAFLRIRQLTLTQPFPFIEDCLKSSYLAYAKRAKFSATASVANILPTLTFMGNCVVELYSMDYASSYQHAFIYIRQLALHLRTALQKKTPEAVKVVYCWQYIHCLKLWSAVLASACGDGSSDDEAKMMRSLVYPLTEIIQGTARLVPSARHLPLRLHCVRLMQQLAASAELYIPTTPILLNALDTKEIYVKPNKAKSRGADVRGVSLVVTLKFPKDGALRTAEQLDASLGEIFLLLNREVDLYRYSAGFPEFTIRICQRLRKFTKETKNSKYRAFARGCIDLCERHSLVAVRARADLQIAPKDVKRLEVLKPSNAPNMKDRYESSISKEKRLESISQPVMSESSLSKKKNDSGKNANAKQTEKQQQQQSKKKPSKKKNIPKQDEMNVENALDLDDEVEEGVDWSDDDDDDNMGDIMAK